MDPKYTDADGSLCAAWNKASKLIMYEVSARTKYLALQKEEEDTQLSNNVSAWIIKSKVFAVENPSTAIVVVSLSSIMSRFFRSFFRPVASVTWSIGAVAPAEDFSFLLAATGTAKRRSILPGIFVDCDAKLFRCHSLNTSSSMLLIIPTKRQLPLINTSCDHCRGFSMLHSRC